MSRADRPFLRSSLFFILLGFLSGGSLRAGMPVAGFPLAGHGLAGIATPGPLGPGIPAAIRQESPGGGISPWWTHLYGAAYYDTRWDGWFFQSYLQEGYDLLPERLLSLYGIGWLTADTRSTGAGPRPAIISDNIFLAGLGLRYRPSQFFWIDAQEGLAFDLVERNGSKAARGDFRLIATGGYGIYPEFLVHPEVRSPMTLLADFFASAGYYSRYKNVIGYLQGRLGVRVFEVSRMFMDAYLRGDYGWDTEGKFYNNFLEIGPGMRFTPDPDWGLFLMVEYHRGYYAGLTDDMRIRRAQFYDAQYDAVRFLLVFERDF